MKIACQSCQAKYTIADEKVLGKVVKIRCKKCGATIVVNGQEDAGHGGAPEEATEVRSSSADLGAGQGEAEGWTVNVADDDQRTLSTQQIVAEFSRGTINDETYCWRDGMGDWLPLKEIEELAQACGLMGGGFAAPPARGSVRPAATAAAAPSASSYAGAAIPQSQRGAAVAAATARRAGGRAPAADLFGAAAEAGGENDVMTSAPQNPNAAHDDGKMTGQRNENSVLFSLNALTATAGPAKKNETTAQGDGSGLIDIRALSSAMAATGGAPKKASHADDIMNLGGGGAFSAALAAPVLTAPPLDSHDGGPGGASAGPNKTILIAAGIGGFVLVAMFAIYMFSRPSTKPDAVAANAEGSAAASSTGAPGSPPGPATTSAPVAANDPAAAAAGGAAPSPDTAKAPSVGAARRSSGGSQASSPAAPPPAAVAVNTPPPAAPAGPRSLEQMMGGAVGAKPAAPAAAPAGGGTDPFDRGAASGSLGSIDVSGCKKPDGPTGPGHVSITFSPSGTVATAIVDQPPFAGTAVGGCVAGKFRSAHVPPFAGGPTKVGKSFVIN
jgi:predicted Zn finger-like uncharacterized protein